jgi:uncharacterized protein YjlB
MPLFRSSSQLAGDREWPTWCGFSAAGIFSVAPGGHFDRHYHDCDEYWLVFQGKARILTEGVEYDVGRGDIVCTHAGEEHDVLGIWEDFAAFYVEDRVLPDGKRGHLHRNAELANGHVVPPMTVVAAAVPKTDHVV